MTPLWRGKGLAGRSAETSLSSTGPVQADLCLPLERLVPEVSSSRRLSVGDYSRIRVSTAFEHQPTSGEHRPSRSASLPSTSSTSTSHTAASAAAAAAAAANVTAVVVLPASTATAIATSACVF